MRLSFAGRNSELEQLRTLYLQGRHVLIVGPPGIGKTALLNEFRTRAPLPSIVAAQNDRASGPIFGAQIPQPRQTFSIFKGKQPLTAYFIWWCRSLALALDQLAVPGDANWNRATKHVSLWRHEHRRLALFGCCILFYCRDQRGDWRHLADHGARDALVWRRPSCGCGLLGTITEF